MTSISVILRDPHLGMTIEAGAAARLRLIAGPGGGPAGSRWSWSGAVPAGSGEERRVSLDAPGVYEIEIILPSGRVLSEQHEVAEGQDLRLSFSASGQRDGPDVRFDREGEARSDARAPVATTDDPPRERGEDLLLGGKATRRRRPRRFLSGGVNGLLNRLPSVGGKPGAPSRPGSVDSPLAALSGRGPAVSTWDVVERLTPGLDRNAVVRTISEVFATVTALPATGRNVGADLLLWRLTAASVPADERAFAALSTARGVELAVLPLPWADGSGRASTGVEVTLDGSGDGGGAFRTRVAVHDRLVGGLLAYLSGGNLHGARTILDDLTNGASATLGRNASPLAMAAAGYVTMATERSGGAGPRDEELRDLMERHPWLPDGAILYARHKLRFARSVSDVEAARAAVRQAYARGLPFFSAGVENLADALALAAAGDAELEAMGRTVSTARLRIDPGQAFTVLRVG